MGKEFTVNMPVELEEGYGSWFDVIYDEIDRVEDVEAGVVRIAPDTVEVIGGEVCVRPGNWCYIPVANFQRREELWVDDTHDFRDRFFDTEEEANEHVEYTMRRWANPSPWESFIQL